MPLTTRAHDFVANTLIVSQEVDDDFNLLYANLTSKTLHVNTTVVGNVGAAGPDNLMSFSVPANTLKGTNDFLRVTMSLAYNSADNTKNYNWQYGGVTISAAADAAASNGNINQAILIDVIIVRTGATTANFYSRYMSQDTAQSSLSTGDKFFYRTTLAAAITHANANTMLVQVTSSVADNDITQNLMLIEVTNL